jgi:hypothetical protein
MSYQLTGFVLGMGPANHRIPALEAGQSPSLAHAASGLMGEKAKEGKTVEGGRFRHDNDLWRWRKPTFNLPRL